MATLAHSPSQAQRATTATQAAQGAADKSHPAPPLPPHPLLRTPTQAAQRTPHGIQTPFRGPFPLVPSLPLIQTHGVPRAQAQLAASPDQLATTTPHCPRHSLASTNQVRAEAYASPNPALAYTSQSPALTHDTRPNPARAQPQDRHQMEF